MTGEPHLAVVGMGFIGSRVVRRALRDGWTVTALTRRATPTTDLSAVRLVTGDATDPDAVQRAVGHADWVVYAAGDSKPADSDADPISYATRNLDPLLHVLRAVGSGEARGLTFLSSGGAVYGPDAPVPTPEDAPLWPASSYGVIKATAEQYVALHARRHGFAADVLRCANVFGPGEPTSGSQGLIGVARARMRAGEPVVVFGDGSTRRDFLHVDDLADVVVRLAARPDGTRVLNVGSGHSVSISDILTALAADLGIAPQVEVRPARASDVPVTQLDVGRLRGILDFVPRDTLSALTAGP